MNILKPILPFILLIVLCSCKEKKNEKTANGIETSKDAAIMVTMEGKTHSIQQKDIMAKAVNFDSDTLQFMFMAKDNPFNLNLNLSNTDIINKGGAIYSLPEADTGEVTIDLNFLNAEREGKKMNRRIVFRKGTLNIQKLTKNNLQMTFEGEGRPMMDIKNEHSFPISGKINVTY